jgi:hypothetical protein
MMPLAYILAASHSGSTLLCMSLGSHPQIATIGEINLAAGAMGDLHRYRCSCGVLIQECGFWREVRDNMAKRGFPFDLADAGTDYRAIPSRYARRLLAPMYHGRVLESVRDAALTLSPVWWRRSREIHERNTALISTIREIHRAQIVVDSSKIAVRLKYLLRNPQLDVKVIRLVRDGRAVALTYMDPAAFADAKDPIYRGGGMGGDRESERLLMAQAARDWRRCMEEADNILRRLDRTRWIQVRYEDYCRDPEATLSRLHRFLGVASRQHFEGFRQGQHVVGNGMRLDATSEIRLDERWRNALGEQDLRIFDEVAGDVNRRCGYE